MSKTNYSMKRLLTHLNKSALGAKALSDYVYFRQADLNEITVIRPLQANFLRNAAVCMQIQIFELIRSNGSRFLSDFTVEDSYKMA